jgi:hypothetical protein
LAWLYTGGKRLISVSRMSVKAACLQMSKNISRKSIMKKMY